MVLIGITFLPPKNIHNHVSSTDFTYLARKIGLGVQKHEKRPKVNIGPFFDHFDRSDIVEDDKAKKSWQV